MTTTPGGQDDRVLFEVDSAHRIATIMLNNPAQRNSYDAAMRDSLARYLDRVAEDDDLTVVLLRGASGVFSTGADMNNATPGTAATTANRPRAAGPASAGASPSAASLSASTTTSWGFPR